MSNSVLQFTNAWVITDAYGQIRRVSREARVLLGLGEARRGENLLRVFPEHCKALVFDIEVALTGWPTDRTLVLRPFTPRPRSIRYRVSRRIQTGQVELCWQLHAADTNETLRCA